MPEGLHTADPRHDDDARLGVWVEVADAAYGRYVALYDDPAAETPPGEALGAPTMTSSIPSPLKSPAPATDCPALSPAATPNICVWKVADGSDLIGPNVTVLTSVPARSRVLAAPPRTIQLPSAVAAREDELRGRS